MAQNNARGFLDLARYCEDIVGQIFNILYGFSLRNLNRQEANFPIVDLGDPAQGVYVQVTALQSHQRQKIAETTTGFLAKRAGNKLFIFFVFDKPDRSSDLVSSKEVTVLDGAELIQKIHEASPAQQEEVLALLRRVEDASLANPPIDLFVQDREFNVPKSCTPSPLYSSLFTYGLGRVRVDAYLPISYNDTFSCCFSFSKRELASVNPSLSGREGARILFTNRDRGLSPERLFVGFIHPEKDVVRIHLGSATIHIDLDTATQLCQLIDALYESYTDHRERILSIMGSAGFDTEKLNRIPVLHLAKDI